MRYNLIYISPHWYEDLIGGLELVIEESDDKYLRSTAKSILTRMQEAGVKRHLDKGDLAQIVVTDKERNLVRSLSKALGFEEMEKEFSHLRPKGWY